MANTSSVVRVGFIGMGYWGPNLLRSFVEAEACEVVGVSDLKPGRLALIRNRYPHLKTTPDYRDFLDDAKVDAVCVATPVSTHYALVKEALRAGKHVLVTKPLADSTARAAEIVELARSQQKSVLVDHTFVFSAPVRKIRKLIQGGDLGRVCYVETTRMNLGPPACEVDVVWDLMPHDLSILLYWLGEFPREITAKGWKFVRKDLCDVALARVEFPSGAFASLHASWLSPQKTRQTYIFAERKMVKYDDLDPIARVKVFDEGSDNRIGANDQVEVDFRYGRGDIWIPKLEETEPLRVESAHFIRCILDAKPLVSGAELGLEVVQLLEAFSASMARDGEPVRPGTAAAVAPPS